MRRTLHRRARRCGAALFLHALFVASAAAQLPGPECPRNYGEERENWISRCRTEESVKNMRLGQEAVSRTRAALLKRPPLAPGSNPLLGRWKAKRAAAARGDLLGQITGTLNNSTCAAMFGSDDVEFRADTWLSVSGNREESLGRVTYRRTADGHVYALPAQGVQLLPFDVNGPDDVTFTLGSQQCALQRVAAPAAPGASASAGPPAPSTASSNSTGTGKTAIAAGDGSRIVDETAFRCSDGKLVFVKYCAPGGANAGCQVFELQQPAARRNRLGELLTLAETNRRVKGCEAGSVRFEADETAIFERSR